MSLGGPPDHQDEWVTRSSDFLRWRDPQQQTRLLWIEGGASQRQTQLLYNISNDLQQSVDGLVLFLLGQATENSLASTAEVMRGLIFLLVKQRPSLGLHIQRESDRSRRADFHGPDSAAVLSYLLTAMLADPNLPDTYVIINVLGEPDGDFPRFLDLLVQGLVPPRIRWLVAGPMKGNMGYKLNTDGYGTAMSIKLTDATEPDPSPLEERIDPGVPVPISPARLTKEASRRSPQSMSDHVASTSTSTAQSASEVKDRSPTGNTLLARILNSFATSDYDDDKKNFLPEGCFDVLVTYESVVEELGLEKVYLEDNHGANDLVEFILRKAKRLFITALFIHFPDPPPLLSQVMSIFKEVDFDDTFLPITPSDRLKAPFFKDGTDNVRAPWTYSKINSFCKHQWSFLAPVFHRMDHMNLRPEHILPFLKPRRDVFYRYRQNSSYRQIRVHPDHLLDPIFPIFTVRVFHKMFFS